MMIFFIKGMAIGLAIGYILWKIVTRLIGYFIRKSRRQKDIGKLLERYEAAGQSE